MEQSIDVPVPQVLEEIVQVVQITLQERIRERGVTDCRCASVPDLEEIVNVVRLTSATADRRAIVVGLFHRLWRKVSRLSKNALQERISERICEQIVDVPVPQVVEQVVEVEFCCQFLV